MFVFAFPNLGQSRQTGSPGDIALPEKLSLLSELEGLGARAKQLNNPLARAMAEAEVADAAWSIDRDLAKYLLRDSYGLTFPEEADQSKLRNRPVGSAPRFSTSIDNARQNVRRRVMEVARREKHFADELAQSLTEKLGPYESHQSYASLAREAINQGDNGAGSKYIIQAIDADPTQISASIEIGRLATKDRAAADQAIIGYINRLRSVTLSFRNGSEQRVFYALATLVPFPTTNLGVQGATIASPGPAVIRTYVAYTLEILNQMDVVGLTSSRGFLLAVWPLLERYSPELKQQFFDLEQRSRKPGEYFSLPTTKSLDEEYKAKYDKQVQKELDSDQPDEIVIQRVISRGDFAKARKMIDKLAEGTHKTELLETLNAQQAISLANKGDIPGAQKLAESLVKAASIVRVFPIIAGKCAAKNDEGCARDAVNQAVKQLKKADVTPFAPPPGVPASIMGSNKDFDPVLRSLGSLAAAVISLKADLALDVLDELVMAANHSDLDTAQGRTGFETSLFKKLAEKDEARTTAAAIQLQDPLRQIVALAAIDQWKSDKIAAEEKLRSAKNEGPSVKKN
jgi:hypothetical protein